MGCGAQAVRTQIIKPSRADNIATASNPIDTESMPSPMQTEFPARFPWGVGICVTAMGVDVVTMEVT